MCTTFVMFQESESGDTDSTHSSNLHIAKIERGTRISTASKKDELAWPATGLAARSSASFDTVLLIHIPSLNSDN